jgi:predicted ATP-dependent protease
VAPLEGTIGQPRAVDAIEFGLEVETPGYNLFVAGQPGSGRESTVIDHLGRHARRRPPPDDWIYVHNFDEPDRPNAIRLPAGRGGELKRDLDEFLATARQEIPRAFESEEYERRRHDVLAAANRPREELMGELRRFARERGFTVEMTPAGIVSVPLLADGRPSPPDQIAQLTPEQREILDRRGAEIQERVADGLRELRRLDKELSERISALNREVAEFAVGPPLADLREKYAGEQEVRRHLDRVKAEIPSHLADFRPEDEAHERPQGPLGGLESLQGEQHLVRYRVNLLVDNSDSDGAPMVVERNATYYNLIGRIDYRAAFGTMVTDFHQIKPGALHRANGGFLILDALEVLRNQFSWDALKRVLLSREVRVENPAEQLTPVPTTTLRPDPIDLDVKVVLIGPPGLYHLLYLDDDFRDLFKVKVDFAPDMDWNDDHVEDYAAFISRWVEHAGLKHFDRSAVARLVEYGGRLRDDQRKLSTRLLDISDVVSEASFWAGKANHDDVLAEDVDEAVARKEYRSNLVEERLQEMIDQGAIMIDTEGAKPGQVNGLSILDVGDYRFGKPSRVTARVSLGRGQVESIEREIEMSGPIHSKGFLTLSGYLAQQYAQDWPLALRATLTFEQGYNEVDGDSASSTELYALLSALSGLPLKQGIAVTGSVNQHGEVQVVGGVTRKIEGFFATCKAKGLDGEQGAIVPAANVPNLMLADEVIEAVEAGRFHVWAVRTIDEGIELLTGQPAGERGPDGEYPARTVHRLVEDRLRHYAERLQSFGAPDASGAGPPAGGQGGGI